MPSYLNDFWFIYSGYFYFLFLSSLILSSPLRSFFYSWSFSSVVQVATIALLLFLCFRLSIPFIRHLVWLLFSFKVYVISLLSQLRFIIKMVWNKVLGEWTAALHVYCDIETFNEWEKADKKRRARENNKIIQFNTCTTQNVLIKMKTHLKAHHKCRMENGVISLAIINLFNGNG